MNSRVHITVYGRVQGVGFRYYAIQQARMLGVHGWIRNRADGSVEGIFEGSEASVLALVDWCRLGPATARIEKVDLHKEPFTGEFGEFSVNR
ncbi:MAG TPA: acylphosphatase [Deltaproteobacteria bacterium]|nr:acylphosphatase [Deltaproteobacteria bacterium]HQB39039.1 acylphosphatase [Deltaproteobacteria bacterium]